MRTRRVFSDLLDKDMMKVILSSELMKNLRFVLEGGIVKVRVTDPPCLYSHSSPFPKIRRALCQS
jgi:hypothetical protein